MLEHIVDTIFAQRLYRVLMLLNRLLNIGQGAFIEFIGHLLVMIYSAQELQDGLLDRGTFLDL